MDRLVNVSVAAKMLGVSTKIMRIWDNEGKVEAVRTAGGHRRYRVSEIENLQGIETFQNEVQVALPTRRSPKIYPVGHKCNGYTVISEKQIRLGIKPAQRCKCKCGKEDWIATYRLNITNNGAVTSCWQCAQIDYWPQITKEYLYQEYCEKRRTIKDIAEEHKCDVGTISRRINLFDLPSHLFEIHNLAGRKFGKWQVLEKVIVKYETSTNKIDYLCKCECGRQSKVHGSHLLDGFSTQCKQCAGCESRGCNSVHWKGYEEIGGYHWGRIKRRAEKCGFPFDIDIEYVWNLFIQQNKLCSLTDWPLRFKSHHKDDPATASLDRIDSSKGYIKGNVQWVHKDVNILKLDHNEDRFVEICTAVAKKKSGGNSDRI